MSKRIAAAGIFAALALIFSYVESLLPISLGIPGIRLGLANLVVVTGLYVMKLPDVCVISLVRILASGLLFGNLMSLLYSLAGGILSLGGMYFLKRTEQFSVIGVSAAGGAVHNTGQILVALVVTRVPAIAYYLPVLIGVGTLTGVLIGFVSSKILRILTASSYFRNSRS